MFRNKLYTKLLQEIEIVIKYLFQMQLNESNVYKLVESLDLLSSITMFTLIKKLISFIYFCFFRIGIK